MKQTVSGVLNLSDVAEISPDLRVKIAVSRDCRVLQSQVFALQADQQALEFELEFEHEHAAPMGVRVLVGPDVPDDQLRSIEHQQLWVSAG
ncbi:MAG: hypothetical protein ACOC9H_00280, partial [Gemmatimonadota bacterium]